jgi:co-chaperonin GroES (HSP10)
MKEREKLAVDKEGNLIPTGQKQISIDDINELQECNYVPYGHETLLQMLSTKEQVTQSGIILPKTERGEIKAIVAATNEHSGLTRGQVVRLDGMMFGQTGVWIDYIEGKPFTQVPNHFIKGVYQGINLSNWKNNEHN